jgi:small subunit ribosomal protein S7
MVFQKNKNFQKHSNLHFFFSFVLRKFLSQLTKKGKKAQAEKILKNIFIKISLKGYSPVEVVTLAINNVKPFVEVRNVRLKGKSFFVPFPLQLSRQVSLSLKTILRASHSQGKKKIENLLVTELINSSFNQGQSVKMTLALHKLAIQNRLFIHYRWF